LEEIVWAKTQKPAAAKASQKSHDSVAEERDIHKGADPMVYVTHTSTNNCRVSAAQTILKGLIQ
jgi:hypothetical protein